MDVRGARPPVRGRTGARPSVHERTGAALLVHDEEERGLAGRGAQPREPATPPSSPARPAAGSSTARESPRCCMDVREAAPSPAETCGQARPTPAGIRPGQSHSTGGTQPGASHLARRHGTQLDVTSPSRGNRQIPPARAGATDRPPSPRAGERTDRRLLAKTYGQEPPGGVRAGCLTCPGVSFREDCGRSRWRLGRGLHATGPSRRSASPGQRFGALAAPHPAVPRVKQITFCVDLSGMGEPAPSGFAVGAAGRPDRVRVRALVRGGRGLRRGASSAGAGRSTFLSIRYWVAHFPCGVRVLASP